ncbi:hypothetical protein L7F22_030273 [Adiantum nelumboides]|nr:hypothetical protein [Adiantum nelumboides]
MLESPGLSAKVDPYGDVFSPYVLAFTLSAGGLRHRILQNQHSNISPYGEGPESKDTANTIYTDSQSPLTVARNPVFHDRTKHIKVQYHYVMERLQARETGLAYVPTQDNLIDLFTKALSREKLEAFRKALGLLPFVD